MEFNNAAEDTSAGGSLFPLAATSQQLYVFEILSFTLDRLHKESELLCVQVEWIRRQMQEVAVGNYRAFIAAANAWLAIREEVSSINKHLESLILEKRKMNQTLLANHSTLFDFLEIPKLMDTCVRNGNFDEALDLEAFLPECLRIIGYLRRIGVFSEYEMRLQRNAYEYLKGMINCHRMHLFDVVNQYRAIFVDDTLRSEENYDGGLLFSWAMHHITSHLMIKGYSFQECFLAMPWLGDEFSPPLPFDGSALSMNPRTQEPKAQGGEQPSKNPNPEFMTLLLNIQRQLDEQATIMQQQALQGQQHGRIIDPELNEFEDDGLNISQDYVKRAYRAEHHLNQLKEMKQPMFENRRKQGEQSGNQNNGSRNKGQQGGQQQGQNRNNNK
ncbi:hypothetical protein UlMin_031311 [Ulmus minor]